MAAHFFGSDRSDPELVIRNMRSAWERIVHERVQERLKVVFLRLSFPFFPVSGVSGGGLYEKYSEQARRSRNSTSKVVSQELEDALRAMENNVVEKALDIYEDEAPEKPIKSSDLLWGIYNFGLVPFIENEVLRDVCSRLSEAQPSLGLDMWRPDAERFFSYNSAGLRKQFPVVIRIVDELKSQWREKILQRAQQTNIRAVAVSSAALPRDQPAGKAVEAQTQTIQQPPPNLPLGQPSHRTSTESSTPINSANEMNKAEPEKEPAQSPSTDVEQVARAVAKHGNAIATNNRSSPASAPKTLKWEDIEIRFLSDDRVQIHIRNKAAETLNYAEFSFMNRKTEMPNLAWIALREMAGRDGIIRDETQTSVRWEKFERRVQEIRRVLRKHFGMSSDPIPYSKGAGYKTQFKLSRGPSFRK